jgi:hypothetical protein
VCSRGVARGELPREEERRAAALRLEVEACGYQLARRLPGAVLPERGDDRDSRELRREAGERRREALDEDPVAGA